MCDGAAILPALFDLSAARQFSALSNDPLENYFGRNTGSIMRKKSVRGKLKSRRTQERDQGASAQAFSNKVASPIRVTLAECFIDLPRKMALLLVLTKSGGAVH